MKALTGIFGALVLGAVVAVIISVAKIGFDQYTTSAPLWVFLASLVLTGMVCLHWRRKGIVGHMTKVGFQLIVAVFGLDVMKALFPDEFAIITASVWVMAFIVPFVAFMLGYEKWQQQYRISE